MTDSYNLNAWASTIDPATLAQALSVSGSALSAAFKNNTGAFIVSSPAAMAEAMSSNDTHPLSIQSNPISFFYPRLGNSPFVDTSRFPAAEKMGATIVKLAPREVRMPHYHSGMDEWGFVIDGPVEFQVYNGGTNYSVSSIGDGDLFIAPRGHAHYLFNPSYTDPVFGILFFNSGRFTNLELVTMLGTTGPAVAAASFGASRAFMSTINYKNYGVVPANSSLAY
jgi:oxalate decarboxylase/phosphoglucose isomerase-like protein (cupin superfamily)